MMKNGMLQMLICALVLVLVLPVVGYAQGGDPVQVEVWVTWDLEEGGSAHELKVIAEEYNLSQDKVKVVLVTQPGKGFSDKVYMSVANGVGPDAIISFANTLPEYVEAGLLADMGLYIDTELLASRLSENILAECYGFADSKLHIIPVQSTATVLFYNKTLFDDLNLLPPATWEEVEAASRAIYDAKGCRGFGAESYTDLAQMLFMQTGAKYIDEDTKQVGFGTEACEEALEWFVNNANAGLFASTFQTGTLEGDFNSSRLASFVGTCTYKNFLEPDGFELGVAPTPTGEVAWAPSFNRGMIVFKSTEAEEAAICDFAEYFTNRANSARWCMSIDALSPYNDAVEEADYAAYVDADEVLGAALTTMKYASSTPAVIGASIVRTELKNLLLVTIDGQKNCADALADTVEKCNQALACD